jgi:plastocyanin
MGDSVFEPRVASVRTGTTVIWKNNGALRHTVTSSDGLFDSDLLRSGETFRVTFTRAGTFAYVCAIHPGMGGVVEVTGAATGGALTTSTTASPTPPPTPSPTASATPTPPPAAAPTASVAAGDSFFDPKDLEVVVGTAVTWTNRGLLKHTVTFTDGVTSELLAAGQTYSRTFTAAGTHPYLCALHPEMKGTITVVARSSPIPALGTTATAMPSPRGSATPDAVRASDSGTGALRGDWPMGMLLGAVLALMGFVGIAGPLALVFLQDARRPPMKT